MNRSYVGVVTAQGLQAIYQESDHLLRFLNRRLYRKQPFLGLCCWAVMAEEFADQIERQTKVGDSQSALRAFQENAIHFGSILPSEREDL